MIAAFTRCTVLALVALALVSTTTPVTADPPKNLVPFPEDAADPPAQPVKPAPPKSDFQPRFRPPAVKQADAVKQAEAIEPAEQNGDGVMDSAVTPASATEPVAAEKAPAETTTAEPTPAAAEGQQLSTDDATSYYTPAPTKSQGREALNEAFTKSKTASTDEDYSAIIALCDQGKQGGVTPAYQQYSDQLMGWAYNRRGEVRAKSGKDAEALADFEAAVRMGGAWRAMHNRGVSYAAAGRLENALADFDRTIELNPRYPNAYFNRAELRYRLGEFPAAVEDYSQAIKLGKPDAAAFNGRGHALYRLRKFGDALRDYGEAIKLDPTQPDPLINRGDTHSDLGQYGEAAADYRAAVKVAPDSGRAFQAAAWLMATCPDAHYRDDKLAVDAARRAIELDGPNYRALSTLAAAQASAGQFKDAQQSQERAIAAAPKDQIVTGEKMMSLYQRDMAFRDRPLTAFNTPEEMNERAVRQASVDEPFSGPPVNRRADFQSMPLQGEAAQQAMPQAQQPRQYQWDGFQGQTPGQPRQLPPQQFRQQPQRMPQMQQQPQRARLFSPKGRI